MDKNTIHLIKKQHDAYYKLSIFEFVMEESFFPINPQKNNENDRQTAHHQ